MYSSSDDKKKVECPFCNYKMPLTFNSRAICRGLYVRCKNRNCKQLFEVVINSESSDNK